MGNKSDRTGKHFLFYLALSCLVVTLNTVSCAPVQNKVLNVRTYMKLEEYRENMAAGHFETVIEQSNQILAENDTKPPADVALFSLGKVYVHHDFAGRDYELSQDYFEKLIKNFPNSDLAFEARTYISLFEAIAAGEKEKAAAEHKLLQKEKESGAAPDEQLREKEIIVTKEKKSTPLSGIGKVVEKRNFEEAVEKNLQIVEEFGSNKPADEALYNLGRIYAHVDNPAKDYNKSKIYFHELSKQFPDSAFAEEARIWLGLFETIEKIQQIDIDIEQQKKQLTR